MQKGMTADIWKDFNKELLGFIKARVNDPDLADDILQDVFIKVHQKSHLLADQDKLASWLYTIARNTIIDHYRKNNPEQPGNTFEETIPEEINERNNEFTPCLLPFIRKLPAKYKDALLKTVYGNQSQKAYAEANGLSYTATKTRVQRARKQLKTLFVDCCALQADKYGNIISSSKDDCAC